MAGGCRFVTSNEIEWLTSEEQENIMLHLDARWSMYIIVAEEYSRLFAGLPNLTYFDQVRQLIDGLKTYETKIRLQSVCTHRGDDCDGLREFIARLLLSLYPLPQSAPTVEELRQLGD
jgi:hypothetical protein